MRWIVLVLALAGCGDNTPAIPTTIVDVDVVPADCAQTGECYAYGLLHDCDAAYFSRFDADTQMIEAVADDAPAFLVQLHYGGDPTVVVDDAYINAYAATPAEVAHVVAVFDPSIVLYGIDRDGAVVERDTAHLVSDDGTSMVFDYGAVETHVVGAPRRIPVDVSAPFPLEACCSAGRPSELGVTLAIALLFRRRRR